MAARAPGRLPECAAAAQVYGLSADNLRRRGAPELGALLALVEGALGRELAGLRSRGVRLRFPGERALLPASVRAVAARRAPPGPFNGVARRMPHSRMRAASGARAGARLSPGSALVCDVCACQGREQGMSLHRLVAGRLAACKLDSCIALRRRCLLN